VKNLEKGQPHGILCQKREMEGYTPWMKRDGLYTSEVVGSETIYIGYA